MKTAFGMCAVLLALSCASVSAQLTAAEPRAVERVLDGAATLQWPACEPASWRPGALEAALEVELQSIDTQARTGVWHLAIDGGCADVDRAPTLRATTSERALERTLALADIPAQLRARALALALAELLRAALTHGAETAMRAPQPMAADALPAIAIALRPEMRVFLAHRDVMFGAELVVQLRRWTVGVAGIVGMYADPLGSARAGVVHALLGYRLLATHVGRFGFGAGPRIGAGLTFGSATSATDATMSSAALLAWDAGAELYVDLDLGAGWSLGVRGLGGYAGGGRFVADNRLLVQTAGGFVGAALNVTASWD